MMTRIDENPNVIEIPVVEDWCRKCSGATCRADAGRAEKVVLEDATGVPSDSRTTMEVHNLKRCLWGTVLGLSLLLGCSSPTVSESDAPQPTSPASVVSIRLERVVSRLQAPVGIVHAGDGSGRLFLVLQAGEIVIYDGTQVLRAPFLDIKDRVGSGNERGLLGLAFHPDFTRNGQFFVNYTNNHGDTIVARFFVSADPNIADAQSEQMVLTLAQPFSNHNGGQLQFGPDRFLYIGTGDGGAGGDPGNRAQNLADLLGKMLRVDVNGDDFPNDATKNYAIPADNPFIQDPGARDEIWSYGLRNPWRYSFDRETGDLFIADVGQNDVEEVHLQMASSQGRENYGWRLMEGSRCFNPPHNCNDGTLSLPILEYSHAFGCSIIGGYRYRGARFPQLVGMYFFSDFCSGRIWGATNVEGQWHATQLLVDSSLSISSFGEDEAGELYLSDVNEGVLFRLVANGGGR